VSNTKNSAVVLCAGPDEEKLLRGSLGDVLDIVATESDPALSAKVVQDLSPDIVLVYLDVHIVAALEAVKEITAEGTQNIIVISRERDADDVLQAMRAGAKDFAYLNGDNNDLLRAVKGIAKEKKLEDNRGGKLAERGGEVVAIFSCKGGSGATTIATNLCGALLGDGSDAQRIVLLDLDFQMGDVTVFLDMVSSYNWRELIRNTHRLDEKLLEQSLSTHPCGLRVVAQTDSPEEADEIDAEGVVNAIKLLRLHHDFVVLDGLRDFREISLAALDSADKILLTMTQDVPALKNANRCLALFKRLGYGEDRVRLIVNRFNRKSDLTLDAITDALQYPVHGSVSNDFPTVIDAINKGSLLTRSAPRAAVTKDYHALVDVVGGGSKKKQAGRSSGRAARNSGFLGLWGRK
jgi:pilus assembly protein CpaE